MTLVSSFAPSTASVDTQTLEALHDLTDPSQLLQVPIEDRRSVESFAEHLSRGLRASTGDDNAPSQIAQILHTHFRAPCLSKEVHQNHELPRTQKPLILLNGVVTANLVSQNELRAAQEFFWTNVESLSSCLRPSTNDLAGVASYLYTRSDFGALRCTWWEEKKLQVLLELSVERDATSCPLTWRASHSNMWNLTLTPGFTSPLTLTIFDLYDAPRALQVRDCVLQGNGFYYLDKESREEASASTRYTCLSAPENDCERGLIYMAEPHNHWVLEVRRDSGEIYRWTHPTAPARQLWGGAWHFSHAWSEVGLEDEALSAPCKIRLVPCPAFFDAKWKAKEKLKTCLTLEDTDKNRYFNKSRLFKVLHLCLVKEPLSRNPWMSLEGLKVLFGELVPPLRALFLQPQTYTYALPEATIIDIGDRLFHLIESIPIESRKTATTLTVYCVHHLGHVLPIQNTAHLDHLDNVDRLKNVPNIYDFYNLLRDKRVLVSSMDPDGIKPLHWTQRVTESSHVPVPISANSAYMTKHQRNQVETFLNSVLEEIGLDHRTSFSRLAAFCVRHFGSQVSLASPGLLPLPSAELQALFNNKTRLEWVLCHFLVSAPKNPDPLRAFAWKDDDEQRDAYIVQNRHRVTLSHTSIQFLGRLLGHESRQNEQARWSNMAALLTNGSVAWNFCRTQMPEATSATYEQVLARWLVTETQQPTSEQPLWLDPQDHFLQLNPSFLVKTPSNPDEIGGFCAVLAATPLHLFPRDQRREVGSLLKVCGSPQMRRGWHVLPNNAARIENLIRDHLIASSQTGDETHPLVWSQGVLVSNHLPKRDIQNVQQEARRLFLQAPLNARDGVSNFAAFYLHRRGHLDGIEMPLLQSVLYDHLVAYSAASVSNFPLRYVGKMLELNPHFELQ